MKPSTKRVLSIGVSILFFIGIIFVYTRLILPTFTAIDAQRGEVMAKEDLFSSQKIAVDQVKNAIAKSQNMEGVRETVALALPEDTNTTEIIHQMNAVANVNQVSFSTFSVETPNIPQGKNFLVKQLGKVRVNMTVFGSYEGIKGFLNGVETNVRIASIQTVDIKPITGGSGELYSMTLKVEFFYQK